MSSLLSDDFSLPPRKTTDWLLDVYFTNSHLFYPWVHKESFLASYETIWCSQNNESPNTNSLPDVGIAGQNCPAQVFYCALNAILAIACEFSNIPSTEKRTSSLMFYERMKGLLNIDFLDGGSSGSCTGFSAGCPIPAMYAVPETMLECRRDGS